MLQQHDTGTQSQARVVRLAAYAPSLRGPASHWIEVTPLRGSGTADDPYKLGSGGAQLTEAAQGFMEMLYEAGWVLKDFGWPAWYATAECQGFLANPTGLADATEQQLAMLLTALARKDRFAEGTLADAKAERRIWSISPSICWRLTGRT